MITMALRFARIHQHGSRRYQYSAPVAIVKIEHRLDADDLVRLAMRAIDEASFDRSGDLDIDTAAQALTRASLEKFVKDTLRWRGADVFEMDPEYYHGEDDLEAAARVAVARLYPEAVA